MREKPGKRRTLAGGTAICGKRDGEIDLKHPRQAVYRVETCLAHADISATVDDPFEVI